MKKCNDKFPFTIGMIPTSYLMSLTYEEQIIWICNYIEKNILELLEKNNQELIELKEYIENYLTGFEELKEEVTNLSNTIDNVITNVNSNTSNINKLNNDLTNAINTLNNKINNDITALKEYSDYQDLLLKQEIENIQIGEILIYNPTTGTRESLQIVINDLYQLSNTDGLTAMEFDNLELTASGFDSKDITAYEFDSKGKIILV